MRGQASTWLLAIGLATWLLAGLLPEGLRICRQSDGGLEVALGCPCDTCSTQHAGSPAVTDCCSGASCQAGQRIEITTVAGPCCTCDELKVLPGINHHRGQIDVPVAVLSAAPTALDPRCDTDSRQAAARAYRAKAPPGAWSPDTIQLLI